MLVLVFHETGKDGHMTLQILVTDVIADSGRQDEVVRVYNEAFAAHRLHAVAEQQVYAEPHLRLALADPAIVKFLAVVDGAVEAFCLVTDDLEKARVNYVNPEFLAQAYPEAYAEKRLFYFTAIAVRPSVQGQGIVFDAMTGEISKYIDAREGLVLFDTSSDVNARLADALRAAALRAQKRYGLISQDARVTKLGAQEYWVLELLRKP